jgi:hypothetical protein
MRRESRLCIVLPVGLAQIARHSVEWRDAAIAQGTKERTFCWRAL